MRLLSPRGAVAVLATAALLAATPVVTATAATRPAQVGLVSFVGASLTSSGATLTVDWADVPGAQKYEVFASTSYDALPEKTTPSATATGSKATITGLSKGKDYFVQVRAVSSAGAGPRSWRVGHRTIVSEAQLSSTAPIYRALTWNICSNVCGSFSSRAKVINTRIVDLKPDVVALQEASNYTTAPGGYGFAYNGQNDILVRSGVVAKVAKNSAGATSGYARFGKKYASPGKGMAWAALKHKDGQYFVVLSVHLLVGTSGNALLQREYEASRVDPFITRTLAALDKSHGSLTDWTKVPVIVMGDFNTQKSRTGDDTMTILKNDGWHDAFDQARTLVKQHYATANPEWSTEPVVAITWGSHIDKMIVKPSRAVVVKWAHAAAMSSGRFVSPLGSDHHPLLFEVGLK